MQAAGIFAFWLPVTGATEYKQAILSVISDTCASLAVIITIVAVKKPNKYFYVF